MVKRISILGSTGSIGVSTLEVIRFHPDRFQIVGLAGGSNVELLSRQVEEFKPRAVSVKSEEDVKNLDQLISRRGGSRTAPTIEILHGPIGAETIASLSETDVVISAIVGAAGLLPTLAAIKAGKTIGLANKESMVIAGAIMQREAQKNGAKILPVDSEHSALFQCLEGHRREDVRKLILTASGGPFLNKPASEFSTITIKEALKHPNWDMGAKITIDSATMMNKGLEVMEARWLFDMPVEKIEVCVHPQSLVHSMVEYRDGSVIAQMGVPDMKIPIAYALSYPERIDTGTKPLDLFRDLQFLKPDLEKFRCLKLAFDVASLGQTFPAVLNAANEVAVAAFLKEEIRFTMIPEIIEKTLAAHRPTDIKNLEDVIEADRWAREHARSEIENSPIMVRQAHHVLSRTP